MRAAYYVVNRMLQRVGIKDGLPRIYNHENNTYVLGYTEINTMATSPFARTKTHKAWFSGDSNIKEGDLIEDRVDGKKYLVMSIKAEFSGGLVAYYDGTLYLVTGNCEVQRLDTDTVDSFGRTTQGWVTVHTGVPIMVNPISLGTDLGEDKLTERSQVKLFMQTKYALNEGDRLVTDSGKKYIVRNIDGESIINLYTLGVEKDTR